MLARQPGRRAFRRGGRWGRGRGASPPRREPNWRLCPVTARAVTISNKAAATSFRSRATSAQSATDPLIAFRGEALAGDRRHRGRGGRWVARGLLEAEIGLDDAPLRNPRRGKRACQASAVDGRGDGVAAERGALGRLWCDPAVQL